MQVFKYLGNLKYRHVQCDYVCARVRVRARACVRACVTIVVQTDMYAVIGILRNVQVFNYLVGNLKYRLQVQCNYNVCARVRVRARACVRACACVTIVVL